MPAEPAVAGLVRVRTLGTIDISLPHDPDASVRTVLKQPKRFALLAYLAAASPRGFHRRDTLLGLFWPELDLGQGRHALRQALHYLKQRLGPVVIRRGDDEVGLDPALLWCDAAAFRQALEQHQPAAALNLYSGDFLPGFFVSGVEAEFEQWLETERSGLRAAAARAAWTVADQAEAQGSVVDAAHWGRKAAALAPDDEGGVRRLMALLDRIGDRAGALRAYEQFAKGLRTEFSADPAPETQVLRSDVRRGRTRKAQSPAATPATPAAAADPDFDQLVGRDHVLRLLGTQLKRALGNSGEPVLVLGEAGMGRTQLARHFAPVARAEGARCLVAHFFDYQGSRLAPHEILLDVLASAFAGEDASIPLADRVSARLGVELPPELTHPGDRGGPMHPAPADPGQVSAALGRCFRRLSRERPLVLVLDDLQWADEATLQVVGYLMQTAVADPLLIVGLARLEEAEDPSHPFSAWLRQEAVARRFTSARLPALTEVEVATAIARVFAGSGGVTLPDTVTATLHQLTGGNPYFLVETIRFLLERRLLIRVAGGGPAGWTWHDPEGRFPGGVADLQTGTSTAERLVLPASLAAAAGARLGRLDPGVRAVVETAAVIGEEFRLRTLAAVEGRDESELEPLLAAAGREGVISESGVSLGEDARFAHTLLRRACYAAIPRRRRRRLHQRVAEALELIHGDGLDRVASAIASHLTAAAQPGSALGWYLRAGRAAVARGQRPEAWEAIDRARAVADETARAGLEIAPDALPSLWLAEGELLLAVGRLRESATALAEAARLARTSVTAGEGGDRELQSLEALALLRLARARHSLGEYAEARASAEAAHSRLRVLGDEPAAAAALVQLGEVATALGDYAGAVPLLEQALATADSARGDPGVMAGAASALGWALALAGDGDRALSFLERAHEFYAAVGDQRQAAHVLQRTQWVHLCRGRYQQAVRLSEAAREAFRSVGDAFGEAKSELGIGQARVYQGLFEEATSYLRRARDATRALGDGHCEAEALWFLARAEVESGRPAEGSVLLESALDLVRGVGDRDDEFRMLIDLAVARLECGDQSSALATADEAVAIARSLGSVDGQGAAEASRAWALLALGRGGEAVEAGRRSIRLLEETRSGERWRGYRALGAALASTGEVEEACDALRRAVALLAAIRDDLAADDGERRAALTRARSEPARALMTQLRKLGRGAEADETARQWDE